MKQNKYIQNNIKDFADYLKDESRLNGNADSISFPGTSQDIYTILNLLKEDNKKITIQGSRTGITGGAVPSGGHILNLSRMNKILGITSDKDTGSINTNTGKYHLKVQPGITLSDIRNSISKDEWDTTDWNDQSKNTLQIMKESGIYFFPPDPTEPSASIGGMIACNASGACSLLYGSTRNYIHALTILLSDGSSVVLERGKQKAVKRNFSVQTNTNRIIKGDLPSYTMPAVKNAAGYYIHDDMDLIDLFIGSEGTLGIIVEAEITLIKQPEYIWGITSFIPGDYVIPFVQIIRGDHLVQGFTKGLPLYPAAIEFFDSNALSLLDKMKNASDAFSSLPRIPKGSLSAVYVEFHADNEDILNETVMSLSEIIIDCNGTEDNTWFATTPNEIERLLAFRHAIPEAVNLYIDMKKKEGLHITKLGTDMAVKDDWLDKVYKLYTSSINECGLHSVMFGHIGNNHIHVNILPESETDFNNGKALYKNWAKDIVRNQGTVSAEHGIGKLKREFLDLMYGDKGIQEMHQIKKLFDPLEILNPGNLFHR